MAAASIRLLNQQPSDNSLFFHYLYVSINPRFTQKIMNRLSQEKSPYLLQHAGNPVDWYPWSEEAFEKARKDDKPVFLSIGYATCHWCHVMEHESFENEDVADLMNRAFVSIKVDREERPDIDNTYMTVCQMITGQGGWPLTIIMTPEKEPFYAATYLPRHSLPNRIGMLDLVPAIEQAWKNDRDRIMESAGRIKEGFSKTLELGKAEGSLPNDIHHLAAESLKSRYDTVYGGFGGSPKFPSPHTLLFLMNYSRLAGDVESGEMAIHTLNRMRQGGIWDHVGGGFHRYSTDEQWLLPHFEKMLYDQALMLTAYAEGWKSGGSELLKETCYGIISYLDECLMSPDGAFYSAEDADSEGEEGRFYIWTKQEIETILDEDDAILFCDLFGIHEEGNFYDEATRQKTGDNIPHLSVPVPEHLAGRVSRILQELHKHRKKRERPLLDDKILTDWNALMISALARAGILLHDDSLTKRAESAFSFLKEPMMNPDGSLMHRYHTGDAAIDGMADDYAFLIGALIDLYHATFNPVFLNDALKLQKTFERRFADSKHGGFYFTADKSEELLGRQKEIYDGAIPSSNSVAAMNGFLLSRLTGQTEYEEVSAGIFRAFSDQVSDAPAGYTHAINALQLMHSDSREIIICSESRDEPCEEMIKTVWKHSLPGTTVLLKTRQTEKQLDEISPFSKNYPIITGQISVYICSGFTCKAPVHTPGELIKILSE
jgi:uncharacterized protein